MKYKVGDRVRIVSCVRLPFEEIVAVGVSDNVNGSGAGYRVMDEEVYLMSKQFKVKLVGTTCPDYYYTIGKTYNATEDVDESDLFDLVDDEGYPSKGRFDSCVHLIGYDAKWIVVEEETRECRSPYCECEKDKCNTGRIDKRGEPLTTKVKSNGGSSDYYKLTITNKKGEKFECETGDVIRCMLGNDFSLGNVLKALRRMYLDSTGSGKEGVDLEYDGNKVKWFIDEFVHFNKENKQ